MCNPNLSNGPDHQIFIIRTFQHHRFSSTLNEMVATFILRAVDALIIDLAIPSPYERTIFIRLLQSTNIVLDNLFGSETVVLGKQLI